MCTSGSSPRRAGLRPYTDERRRAPALEGALLPSAQRQVDGLGEGAVGIVTVKRPDHGAAVAAEPDVQHLLRDDERVVVRPEGGAVEDPRESGPEVAMHGEPL